MAPTCPFENMGHKKFSIEFFKKSKQNLERHNFETLNYGSPLRQGETQVFVITIYQLQVRPQKIKWVF